MLKKLWQEPGFRFWFSVGLAPLLIFWALAGLIEAWNLFWLVVSDRRTTVVLLFLAAGLYYLTTRRR